MIVYDVTDLESFNNLTTWLQEIDKHASKNVYKILVGNKADKEDKRQVTFDQGKEFADSHGMKFIEASAKSSLNVGESFISMTSDIIKQLNQKEVKPEVKEQKIDMTKGAKNISKGQCCK